MNELSLKAKKMILEFEGLDSPPDWPGGASGVTIGIGYDLGYVTVDQFETDWSAHLPADHLFRLRVVIGLKSIKAKNKVGGFSDIKIKRADAEDIFTKRTIPLTLFKIEQAFPCIKNLPDDAQGALVSLVYNRGTSMTDNSPDDRRREMRAIRDAVAKGDLQGIANQLRTMKRLWIGKNSMVC